MKPLIRNRRSIWYANPISDELVPILDDDGYSTGEYTIEYEKPKETKANIGVTKGVSKPTSYGYLYEYQKTIKPIDKIIVSEKTRFWIDIKPTNNTPHNWEGVVEQNSLNYYAIRVKKV